jgi:hypothetical protein
MPPMARPADVQREFDRLRRGAEAESTSEGRFSAPRSAEYWASVTYGSSLHLRALCMEQLGIALTRLAAMWQPGIDLVLGPATRRVAGDGTDTPLDLVSVVGAAQRFLERSRQIAIQVGDAPLAASAAERLDVATQLRRTIAREPQGISDGETFWLSVEEESTAEPPEPPIVLSEIWTRALDPIARDADLVRRIDLATQAKGGGDVTPERDAHNNLVIESYLRRKRTQSASVPPPALPERPTL